MDKLLNEKYSFKDFSEQTFKKLDASEFNNTIIKGSCFYHEAFPEFKVFPDDMVGVVFDRCNLDNVYIPEGNTILTNCTHKKLMVQNDEQTWIIDNDKKPTKPLHVLKDEEGNIISNTDPSLIPLELKQTKKFNKLLWDKYKNNRKFLTDNFFADTKFETNIVDTETTIEVFKEVYDKMLVTNNFAPFYYSPTKVDEYEKLFKVKQGNIIIELTKTIITLTGIVKEIEVSGDKIKINKNKSKIKWVI